MVGKKEKICSVNNITNDDNDHDGNDYDDYYYDKREKIIIRGFSIKI